MTGPDMPADGQADTGDTILVCRNCDSTWGVEDSDDESCLSCGFGTVDPADKPAGVRVPVTPLPVTCGGDRIKRCCRCARTWAAETYHVELRFEDNRVGAVCRYCAHIDAGLSVWQSFCDIADAVDVLMQQADGPAKRRLMAGMVRHAAEWFSVWRDPNSDPGSEARRVVPAPPAARS